MPRYNVIFESDEFISGVIPQSKEWIQYKSKLIVKDGGKKSVTIKMTFVPPHPFVFNMPEEHNITAGSITEAYAKVVRFFGEYGIQFRS